ncbi:hypothetical protein K5E_24200 [Enterococcus thailandicus]|nr:hypothetical protein CK496_03730 [Enterococcus thailandicus]GMC03122.1 hypothetical protein K4E_06390 [Enterococcus thailandicus]GMC10281.1 hypothetical protein K5E_24200 [Enterococcus thailandicus]
MRRRELVFVIFCLVLLITMGGYLIFYFEKISNTLQHTNSEKVRITFSVMTILLGIVMFLQQSFFSLRIPLSVFTPLIGSIGLLIAIRLRRGTYRTVILLANSIMMLVFPIYLVLVFIFPAFFV